ncbi:hypothetical protein B0H10DRAFT_1788019 [Mycena sp. CBHHK59/15]|nr:hypothetical protein B0H10DRAFT_1837522 [Mycena sp. CBHHK59/15]KAJ6622434.1 hypothetical protein B0H10DRAFT_1788019 [Mycena sp. CBHHK59/15]
MASIQSTAELRRVSDLWFADGSLIVQAEDTIFCVSRSILAARSSVFHDMLSFSEAASDSANEVTIGGLPMVHLHDSALDVEFFLRAIFDSSYFMPPPVRTVFGTVLSILRLAHKYDVQYLYRRALSHLAIPFPTTITEWTAILKRSRKKEQSYFEMDRPVAAATLAIIKYASELDALWLLPSAYARICALELDSIVSSDSWSTIDPATQQLCLVLHAQTSQQAAANLRFLTLAPSVECHDPAGCKKQQRSALAWVFKQLGIVNSFGIWIPYSWESTTYCAPCLARAKQAHGAALQKVWDGLPESMGLPPWDELERMRDAAMNDPNRAG